MQVDVLRKRLGFETGDVMTLAQIAAVYQLSIERIRQSEAKALRKLRHPSRADYLRPIVPPISDADAGVYLAGMQTTIEENAWARKLGPSIRVKVLEEVSRDPRLLRELEQQAGVTLGEKGETRLEDLDLSTRTHNTLDAAGITTVSAIMRTPPGELLKVKNFGRKSYNEIRDVLADLDLEYPPK